MDRDALFEKQPYQLGTASATDLFTDDDEIRRGLTSPQSTLDRSVIGNRDAIQAGSPGTLHDLEWPGHGVLRVVRV
jgi:hypothetical protein